jgi:hypothetical protein
MTTALFNIEQRLLVLATAMREERFTEDTEKIRALLIEAANTIIELRRNQPAPASDVWAS